MKVYLGNADLLKVSTPYERALLNFFLTNKNTYEFYEGKDVICDSGAFSFMVDPKRLERTNIDEYCDLYCDCVNRYHIKNFFELDVDTLLGTQKARELRRRIEARTGRAPIPVWHCERGKHGWEEMCDNYDYVALPLSGKTSTSRWLRADRYRKLWWFVDEAHRRGARVHALGLGGNGDIYKKGAFFSCDSVAYTFATRLRWYNVFDPKRGKWQRLRYDSDLRYNPVRARQESIRQWLAFAAWAEVNL